MNTIDPSTIATLLGSVGFPIVACIYMATTFDKKLDANTKATSENSAILLKLFDRLDLQDNRKDENNDTV